MNKHYRLTDKKKIINEHVLYRIEALTDFSDVKKGDLGGWIESESNLSQNNAWVSDDACVYGNAQVYDNALVSGNAQVYDNALVSGNAWVSDDARVSGNALVGDNALVGGDAWVYDNARLSGNARVYDNARVSGNACVYGNAQVYDNARLSGDARISNNADISASDHVYCTGNIGSRQEKTTFFLQKDETIGVNCGCFTGSLEEFLQEVEKTHGNNKHAQVYHLATEIAKIQILENEED